MGRWAASGGGESRLVFAGELTLPKNASLPGSPMALATLLIHHAYRGARPCLDTPSLFSDVSRAMNNREREFGARG